MREISPVRVAVELPLWEERGVMSRTGGSSVLAAFCQSQALFCLPPLLPAEKSKGKWEPVAYATRDRESSEDIGHEVHLPSAQWSFGRAILWLKGKVFCNFSPMCPKFLFIKFRYLKNLSLQSLPVKTNGWGRGRKHLFSAVVETS